MKDWSVSLFPGDKIFFTSDHHEALPEEFSATGKSGFDSPGIDLLSFRDGCAIHTENFVEDQRSPVHWWKGPEGFCDVLFPWTLQKISARFFILPEWFVEPLVSTKTLVFPTFAAIML